MKNRTYISFVIITILTLLSLTQFFDEGKYQASQYEYVIPQYCSTNLQQSDRLTNGFERSNSEEKELTRIKFITFACGNDLQINQIKKQILNNTKSLKVRSLNNYRLTAQDFYGCLSSRSPPS